MDLILRILQMANATSKFCIRVPNPPCPPLVIEDTTMAGPRGYPCISVAHTIRDQHGLRWDPEMLFEVRYRAGSMRLCPFYYRSKARQIEEYSVFWNGRAIIVDAGLQTEHERIAFSWNQELERQGYEAAFQKQLTREAIGSQLEEIES